MIANPFTSALQKGIIAALLLLLVAVGVFASLQWFEAGRLEARLADCQVQSARLSGALDTQNTAVESWRAAASAAQGVSAKALIAAQAANKARVPELRRLTDLLAAGRATDCGPAMGEIREGLR